MAPKKTVTKKTMGRPPAGEDGSFVSLYPKLTITMKTETKARLEALRSIQREPAWRIIDTALTEYFKALPLKDRKALDAIAERIAS